jgi:L-aminopeptidase/D-esterase-like protein
MLPEGILVGHAQDPVAGTGCSAIICKAGAVGAVSVRGAAPATVETDLLAPVNTVDRVNAVVLSGGSAFGLAAADGVRRWLLEHESGLPVLGSLVPIVCGASIFDLNVGDGQVFPDADMGYAACCNAAKSGGLASGNVGAGTGASVGKFFGSQSAMKAGLGMASIRIEKLTVTALAVVNAVGNVCDRRRGLCLAGVRHPDGRTGILDPYMALGMMLDGGQGLMGANTTIGCIITNGSISKTQAARIADAAHDGLARAIEPAHTGFDGDAVFALSTATIPASPELLGALAALVMEEAIHDAALSAKTAYGLPSAADLSAEM